jgi:ABC-type glycerol-3-phosphate transport system substrate-binding protein
MKRNLLIAAALVILVLFAGCKKEGKSTGTTAGTKTPITFSFYNWDAAEDMEFNDPVAKKIT